MSLPQPVDLNRLKNILGASKAIMNKVETGNFETGHVDPRALTEDGVRELQAEGVTRPTMSQYNGNVGYTEETVMNSRLPEGVKKIMLERPIPQLTNPNYTFSLDDVASLSNDKPMGYPKTPKTTPKQTIRESQSQSDMITVSKIELNEIVSAIVNEKLLEFMTRTNNKAITEDAVKKTISLLIKEGKLAPRKKTI